MANNREKKQLKRRRHAPAGRLARHRELEPLRVLALDEHSVQVREEIDAALSVALRLREDIAQRIEQAWT